jgi:hypothetical protein
MIRVSQFLIGLFLVGTIVWAVYNGQWQSAYVVQRVTGEHQYLIDLDSTPLWSPPPAPSFADYSEHFTNDGDPLPSQGKIRVYHMWDSWILGIIMIWLMGFLAITPIAFLFFRRDLALGALARVGAGLIGASLACFVLWLLVGGWGPPAPLLFGILGLIVGGIWAAIYVSQKPTANKTVETTADPLRS